MCTEHVTMISLIADINTLKGDLSRFFVLCVTKSLLILENY